MCGPLVILHKLDQAYSDSPEGKVWKEFSRLCITMSGLNPLLLALDPCVRGDWSGLCSETVVILHLNGSAGKATLRAGHIWNSFLRAVLSRRLKRTVEGITTTGGSGGTEAGRHSTTTGGSGRISTTTGRRPSLSRHLMVAVV